MSFALLRRAVRAFCLRTGRLEGVYRTVGQPTCSEWPEFLRQHRGMTIGPGTTISPLCTFTDLGLVTIGADCTITKADFLTHSVTLDRGARQCYRKPITIGDRVEIYWNAVIRPGATIGSDARIMSGAHVVGDVPPGLVMEGVPAKGVGMTRRYLRQHLRNVASLSIDVSEPED